MNYSSSSHSSTSGFDLPPTHLALYRRLATVFIVLTLLVGAFVFYVVWSRATVIILSRQEEVKAEFIADVASQPSGEELAGTVVEMTESVSRSFPTSALAKSEARAEGRVRIMSRLGVPQTLVATTRLLNPDGVLFRLKDQVVVPAGGTVEADVHSDTVGKGNDIGESTFTIPGLPAALQEQFTVETVAPIAGGLRDVRSVTVADVEAAVAQLKSDLTGSLTDRMRETAVGSGLPVSGEVVETTVMSQKVEPEVGTEAGEFTVTVTVRGQGVFFDRAQLAALAESRVREIVPFGRRLVGLEEKALTLAVERVDLSGRRANLRVSALGNAVLSEDSPALDPAKLSGVTAAAAVTYLEQVAGVASASVKVSPFWSGRLPSAPDNIRVEVR